MAKRMENELIYLKMVIDLMAILFQVQKMVLV